MGGLAVLATVADLEDNMGLVYDEAATTPVGRARLVTVCALAVIGDRILGQISVVVGLAPCLLMLFSRICAGIGVGIAPGCQEERVFLVLSSLCDPAVVL